MLTTHPCIAAELVRDRHRTIAASAERWRRPNPSHQRTSRSLRVFVLALLAAVVATVAGPKALVPNADAAFGAVPTITYSGGRLEVVGTLGIDTITVRSHPGDPARLDIDLQGDGPAELIVDRSTISDVRVSLGPSNDIGRIDGLLGTSLADATPITIDGGAGNDTLTGGTGVDTLLGGGGNDVIDGRFGSDFVDLGGGADVVVWTPGGGNDIIDGRAGIDRALIDGSNASESVTIRSNSTRVTLTRNLGNVTLDLGTIETIEVAALDGADLVAVGDLTTTTTTRVIAKLAMFGGAPDGDVDRVVVAGTNGVDSVRVGGDATAVAVTGLRAAIAVTGVDSADQLEIETQDGVDSVVDLLPAEVMNLYVDGQPMS